MGQTDLQFKNDLRMQLCIFERLLKCLDAGDTEQLRELIQENITRINESLKD